MFLRAHVTSHINNRPFPKDDGKNGKKMVMKLVLSLYDLDLNDVEWPAYTWLENITADKVPNLRGRKALFEFRPKQDKHGRFLVYLKEFLDRKESDQPEQELQPNES